MLLIIRDVYHIESIVSCWYRKTDTGIVSKWQINDTFNDTFYDDFFFFIKCMFCFSFLYYLENDGPWILLYCMLSIPKDQKEKSYFFNGFVSYRIVSVSFCQYRYCIIMIIS